MKFTLYLHFVGLYFENFCLKFCRKCGRQTNSIPGVDPATL